MRGPVPRQPLHHKTKTDLLSNSSCTWTCTNIISTFSSNAHLQGRHATGRASCPFDYRNGRLRRRWICMFYFAAVLRQHGDERERDYRSSWSLSIPVRWCERDCADDVDCVGFLAGLAAAVTNWDLGACTGASALTERRFRILPVNLPRNLHLLLSELTYPREHSAKSPLKQGSAQIFAHALFFVGCELVFGSGSNGG